MRLRWIFALVILLLAAACALLLKYHGILPKAALYTLEAMVILSIALLAIFYRSILRPIKSIMCGVDLLREQDFSSRLAHVGQKEADNIVDMFNAMMTSLKEERLHVREQNHLMDLLIEKSPMGVIMLNGMDVVTSANTAAITQLAATDAIIGKKITEISGPLANVLASLKDGDSVTSTLSDSMIYRCSRLTFIDKGYQHPFFVIEPMTREVKEAQKESYGKVIRVISHEVNNSMTAVDSMLTTIADTAATDPLLAEAIDVCVQRCRSLSRFITSYANVVKIPQAQKRKVSIPQFIDSVHVMLESMCNSHGCTLRIAHTQGNAPDFIAAIDTVMMEQAIINIVKNSIESIESEKPLRKDGEVTIVIDPIARSVTVEDNGPGIADEAAANLFKPFYSTKPNGQGIGLIFIAEALTRNDCSFSLRTCPDGLTRFTITMP